MFFNILLFYYKKYFQTKLHMKHEQMIKIRGLISHIEKSFLQKINYSIYDPLFTIYIYIYIFIQIKLFEIE